jgi:hypothetical protein
VTGVEAIRLLCRGGQYVEAERLAYRQLWEDMEQPQALYWLAVALNAQNRNEDAAVYCTYFLRLADDPRFSVSPEQQREVQQQLEKLDQDFERLRAEHKSTAGQREFDSPENVSDLWMTQVTGDLFSFYDLHHWIVVGGIKDRPYHWNRGRMHRSGMVVFKELHGRKGILYGKTIKGPEEAKGDGYHEKHLERLGHPPHVRVRNVGRHRYLRVGARADGQPAMLQVYVDKERVFSQQIGVQNWEDLKIGLGDDGAQPEEVTLELTVPPGQRYSGEFFLDYADFFPN